jgi:hypothetical protein
MGLTGKTKVEIGEQIIKRNIWDELTEGEKRICVYFRPSRLTVNEIVAQEIIQLDCHVPSKEEYVAYQVQAQAKKLLHKKQVNGRYLYFIGQLGELPSMPGFVCVGGRYSFYATI